MSSWYSASVGVVPAERYDHCRHMSAPPAQIPGSGSSQHKADRRSRRETARAGAVMVLSAIAIAFAVLNLNQVKVDWIVGSGHAPLIVVIVISLLVGIVLTYSAERLGRRRR
jgi:uncharacterized integral membrane protein